MSTYDIGSRRELFVDDTLLDKMTGQAKLALHSPVREEAVFSFDGPMENACSGVYSVLVSGEEGQFLLYYRGSYPMQDQKGDYSEGQTAHVAVSRDGIHFERPELGVFDLGDGGRNNVVWQGIQAHNLVPFRDTNPDCHPEERFKAVGGTGKDNLYALVSPDGFRWRLAQEQPLVVPGAFDSANVAFWDPHIGKYRLFSRFFEEGRERAIQSCTSEDFLQWTPPVAHRYEEGAPVEQFYTNATVPVPWAGHILLSFPMRYVAERETPVEDLSAHQYPGTGQPRMAGMTDAVLMSSRDGVHWKRSFPEAWLRPGLDERNWTHRNTTPAIGIVPLKETEWSMYVSEHYGWPDHRLRRLSIRPWGVGSIRAGHGGGEVTTKPLVFEGTALRLNFSTSAVGSVRVEIQDETGAAFPGFAMEDMSPLYGDRLDFAVAWKGGGDVSRFSGRPVRLRFELSDADVFAFRFNSDAAPKAAGTS